MLKFIKVARSYIWEGEIKCTNIKKIRNNCIGSYIAEKDVGFIVNYRLNKNQQHDAVIKKRQISF